MPSQCATANFLGMERFVGATTGRFGDELKSKKRRRPVFKLMMRDSMNLQYTVELCTTPHPRVRLCVLLSLITNLSLGQDLVQAKSHHMSQRPAC